MRAALLAFAACYAPDTRDCTLTCAAATECGDGQQCTGGLCAAPGTTCTSDAALHVQIMGKGSVVVDTIAVCASDNDTKGDCMLHVPMRVIRQLVAQPVDEHAFAGWSGACAGSDATCSLVPVSAMTQVGARFE